MKSAQAGQKYHRLFRESVTRFQQGDVAGARKGLEKVAKALPDSAAVWYNLGLSSQHLERHHKAVAEYKKSLRLNANQPDALVNLALSHKALTQNKDAKKYAESALQMCPDHARALNLMGSLLAEARQFTEAIDVLEQSLSRDPSNDEVRQNLANALLESGDAIKAEQTLAPLVGLPTVLKAPTQLYVQALLNQKRYTEIPAVLQTLKQSYPGDEDVLVLEMSFCECINDNFSVVDIAEKVLAHSPRHARAWNSLGSAYFQLDSIAKAKASYQSAIAFDTTHPEYINNLGLACASLGEKEKAEQCYRRSLELKTDYIEAHRNLVAMKKFSSLEDPDATALHHLWENRQHTDPVRCKLNFALGKVYDDCGLHDQAFDFYDLGNQLKSQEIDMDFEQYFGHIDRIITVCDQKPAKPTVINAQTNQPIFILGMSRSGTTLVEQIISRHPHVTGCGELACIERAISNLEKNPDQRRVYPDDFPAITQQELSLQAKGYDQWVERLHAPRTRYITDKMPFNFVHIWLIKALFPDAPIVHCHRHPLDVIVSNYFQLFGSDINFVYNLEVLTGYYLRYHKLMRHWDQLFGGEIYRVQYEALVADSDQQTKLLIDAVGLNWDEACLDPSRSETAVRTASIWQVREGIYTSSKERWRHYETHLGGVIQALQSHGILDQHCRYLE